MGIRLWRPFREGLRHGDGRTERRRRLMKALRNGPVADRAAILVATTGGSGFLPRPGLHGGVAGVVAALAIGPGPAAWIALAAWTAIGLAATTRVHSALGLDDPSEVNVDEVVGAALAVLIPGGGWAAIPAFALFCVLDFVKPFPANVMDRSHAAWGVLGDDLVAGLYAGLFVAAAAALASPASV